MLARERGVSSKRFEWSSWFSNRDQSESVFDRSFEMCEWSMKGGVGFGGFVGIVKFRGCWGDVEKGRSLMLLLGFYEKGDESLMFVRLRFVLTVNAAMNTATATATEPSHNQPQIMAVSVV